MVSVLPEADPRVFRVVTAHKQLRAEVDTGRSRDILVSAPSPPPSPLLGHPRYRANSGRPWLVRGECGTSVECESC